MKLVLKLFYGTQNDQVNEMAENRRLRDFLIGNDL